MRNYKEKLKNITTFIFDFDGVISDGKIWVIDRDTQLRNADVKDGYAIHHALKKGYHVAVISGGRGEQMEVRLNCIGVKDVFTQVRYKKDKYEEYIKEKGVTPDQVLYVGDDIPDYEVMELSAIGACPADAAKEILEVADYISHRPGGNGCVRDVIEQVMRARGDWFTEDCFHW